MKFGAEDLFKELEGEESEPQVINNEEKTFFDKHLWESKFFWKQILSLLEVFIKNSNYLKGIVSFLFLIELKALTK